MISNAVGMAIASGMGTEDMAKKLGTATKATIEGHMRQHEDKFDEQERKIRKKPAMYV
jgi:hypothetical protein